MEDSALEILIRLFKTIPIPKNSTTTSSSTSTVANLTRKSFHLVSVNLNAGTILVEDPPVVDENYIHRARVFPDNIYNNYKTPFNPIWVVITPIAIMIILVVLLYFMLVARSERHDNSKKSREKKDGNVLWVEKEPEEKCGVEWDDNQNNISV